MKKVQRTLAAVLAAMMLMALAGCSKGDVTKEVNSGLSDLKAQAAEKGFTSVDWNVCAEDATASHPNAAQILRNVQNDAKDQPICVVLMHDTNATHETVKALPDILEWFAAKGYHFFTVQQMAE